ncbi:MAG: hypothetical protein ACI4RA_06045, partial [Kiritimatiellia bacterium]
MKKAIGCLLVALAAAVARADALYWMVSSESSGVYTYSIANLYAADGAGNSSLLGGWEYGSATESQTVLPPDVAAGGAAYSFYIELVGETGVVAKSDFITVEYAKLQGFISTGAQPANTWNGGHFTAVPEPTSGLLMLLGLAGLA